MKKTLITDQDVHVTNEGRVLRGGDELRTCGVRDGCPVEVMRRLRGGGKTRTGKTRWRRSKAQFRGGQNHHRHSSSKRTKRNRSVTWVKQSVRTWCSRRWRGLDVLGGPEALERLSQGSDDEVDKKMELFLVAFKKSYRLPPVLFEELEKLAKSEVTARRAAMT